MPKQLLDPATERSNALLQRGIRMFAPRMRWILGVIRPRCRRSTTREPKE
jgi:hypothetical protein